MVVQQALLQRPEATVIQLPEPLAPEVPIDDMELAPNDGVTKQLTVAGPELQPAPAVPYLTAIQQPNRLMEPDQ